MTKHPTAWRRAGLAVALCVGMSLTACTPEAATPASTATATPSASPSAAAQATSTAPALPANFPTALIPAMPKLTQVSGTVSPRGEVTDVAFTGTAPSAPAAVDAFYTAHFKKLGFTATASTTVDGVLNKTFIRNNGDETVSLNAAPASGGSTVTIGATVRTASAK
ncbi:MAG: hypothetical protein J7474_12380 [Arthrobacter sp.]|nr:hypothetical protein [Arthrobacter sp.]